MIAPKGVAAICKESAQAGLGKRYTADHGTWGKTLGGKIMRRVGKTERKRITHPRKGPR